MLRLTLQVVQQPALYKVATPDRAGRLAPTMTVHNKKAALLHNFSVLQALETVLSS